MPLETSHHAGLMSLVGHIFPPGYNTADTQVRGSTTDTWKTGAGAQTESPELTGGGVAVGPSAELRSWHHKWTGTLGWFHVLASWGSFYWTALRVLTLSSLWWWPKHPILGMRTGVIGADPGVRGIRILRPIWIPGDGVNTGITVEKCRKVPWETWREILSQPLSEIPTCR